MARAAQRLPVLRRVPAVRLLALAEVALLARDHALRLTPAERRRVLELVRIGRGRRRNLTVREQGELSRLIAKAEPRQLAGEAIDAVSPVKLPRRLVHGSGRGG
jgi:hypothetical protein